MRVLVVGGGGFLGAWVIRTLLADGHDVRVLDRFADRRTVLEVAGQGANDLEWRQGDVAVAGDVDAATRGTDFVIHLAALLTPDCQRNPILGARVNVLGSLHVFEAALRHGLSGVAYASSAGIYGPGDEWVPEPVTHYGAFKLAVEHSARAYWTDHGLTSYGFRPFVIYGPGRHVGSSAGVTLACRAAARGEKYHIGFTGRADFIFVEDVALAFAGAVGTGGRSGAFAFNMFGQECSVDEVIEEIRCHEPSADLSASGPCLPIGPGRRPDGIETVFPDLRRTSLQDGVARTIDHYRPT